ncbi:MAG: hypothetical protein CME84_10140 [Henriciella sp.]|jgi:hypothetical protein|uniref:hypothetical protein n=1 Tax=Henriciella sp. TaxID=1968823 RepID=UPI000C0FF9BD|nr:hypothetical protein [Henriciella sp.]MAN74430.1 hypothetical protein [Henriciella sp.]MBF35185.1 hypothetical protein [Hyphomonadaceae bacterium]PHR75507.1 MAG: hypothetical protein COA64_12000 [Henriciella sp.]|tara:strand:+ start:1814 stop:2152 length:339 start_codon:yes stop_codon:yes gene_type:complete
MSHRFVLACLAPFALAVPAGAQIATSNENGATGAYSDEIDSSFTSEGRFGPRTALDDLRADVDRDREAMERLRQRQQKLRDAVNADDRETLIDNGLPVPITEGDLAIAEDEE